MRTAERPDRHRLPLAVRRLEGWLFCSGSARRLAAVRIGLCAVLAIRLSRDLYAGLAGQPADLYRPISFMRLLPSMPPRALVQVIQVLGVGAALAAALGLWGRLALPVAWCSAVFLNGMATSTGKVVHNDVLLLLCLVPLLAAPAWDRWSLHRGRTREGHARDWSVRYGWPVRTAMVLAAGAYFFTGLAKVAFSGPAWVMSDNLRWVLYAASDSQARPNWLALLIADRPWLAHLVAVATIALELGFVLVLWRPRAAWLLVPGAVALHAAIWAAMRLDYSAQAAAVVILWVNWPGLADALRAEASRAPGQPTTRHGSMRRGAP